MQWNCCLELPTASWHNFSKVEWRRYNVSKILHATHLGVGKELNPDVWLPRQKHYLLSQSAKRCCRCHHLVDKNTCACERCGHTILSARMIVSIVIHNWFWVTATTFQPWHWFISSTEPWDFRWTTILNFVVVPSVQLGEEQAERFWHKLLWVPFWGVWLCLHAVYVVWSSRSHL